MNYTDGFQGFVDDKAVLGEAMGELLPPPESERGLDLLVKWTKYNKTVHPQYHEREIWPVKIDDELSVVAVTRPDTGAVGLVFRQLVDQIAVTDKETGEQKFWPAENGQPARPMVQNRYEIIGVRPAKSAEQALEILDQIRSAVEAVAARDHIPSWGDAGEVGYDEAEAEEDLDIHI